MVRVRYPGKNDFTIQQMDIHDKPKNAGKLIGFQPTNQELKLHILKQPRASTRESSRHHRSTRSQPDQRLSSQVHLSDVSQQT